ncbi:PAS domain-containing sensor histidine kinase [Peribacillus simplex]|uniref:histidine kinase n=1 Tax=Peribacillus simplex TaxID=1478 RepID=A0A9W4PHW9_9BACI|nr:PAS domain-containing protein [Peribacillus simplex]MDR4926766.1 PAS domain S-box protein [Peribacillus simplex]WHX93305.1 PAS domain S-box protein [Peribacillus simplex]CAH0288513.1 Oxygen sensor histidine kinase NreB [Peribacillus simplex]
MDLNKHLEMKKGISPGSSDATILVNESGVISFANQQVYENFGYEHHELNGEKLLNLIPGANLQSSGEGEIIHQFGIHRDGHAFSLSFRVNSFQLAKELYYLIAVHKVKDQSRINQQQSYPVNELVDLIYALDESTIVAFTDEKGKIIYLNKKFCEVSKYSAAELIGKDHRIINSGFHSRGFMQDLWRTISSGSVWRGEIKNKAKDGTYYWVDTTIVPFLNENGNPYKYLAIRKEITEYKRVLEELGKSVNKMADFQFALDSSSIVAITDQRGTIKYVNDQFCRISKFSKEELIGQDHRIINSGFHSREFFNNLWKTISAGEVWKGEIKNKTKDSTYYWVDTTIVPFLDEFNKPYQYLAIRYEVTQRKLAEEEIQKMTGKIIDVQEEERKRISRELHDDIGQNLYSHLITINRLQTEMEHPLLDQMQDEATEIIEALRHLSWELRPSVLDDLGLFPAIRSFLVQFSEHHHIKVHLDCYLNCRLNTNKEITIYRIIQEALTNIRKYAQTEDATVTIREIEEEVRVEIVDKGKGFDIEKVTRGVGLFSMEERARASGGNLILHSGEGKGTKVILKMPL